LPGFLYAKSISDSIKFHVLKAKLAKARAEPLCAGLFSKGRGGDRGQLRLPAHDLLLVEVHPLESAMDAAVGGDLRHAGKGRDSGGGSHEDSA
jgi:hypothetical protein